MTGEAGQEGLPEGEEALAAEAQAALSEVATPVEHAQRPYYAADAQAGYGQATQPTPVQTAIPGSTTPQPLAAAPVASVPPAAPVSAAPAPAVPPASPDTAAPAQPETAAAPGSSRPEAGAFAPAAAQAETATAHASAPADTSTTHESAQPAATAPVPMTYGTPAAQPVAATTEAETVLPVTTAPAEPAHVEPTSVTDAPVAATPAATASVSVEPAAPAHQETPAQAPAPSYAAPRPAEVSAIKAAETTQPAAKQNLQDVVNAAGLTWVETDPARHAQTQQRMAATHTPVRLGRDRKPVAQVSSAPLEQVETRRG